MQELYIEDFPYRCIRDCSRAGNVDESVAYWRARLNFRIEDREAAIRCLQGYGAWTCEELNAKSDEDLAEIVLWLACGDFNEWDGTDSSPCGSYFFVIE